ncbi:hypothetical protein COCON_G00052380 [Conger conger]|uniref:Uncharacterized protein n=1 Tax=Conger conger TaxID=82655 RepID=A0A9Q1I4X6_CONCO|nr:hypothetical protein COCON_G00052380 [Conger conger]
MILSKPFRIYHTCDEPFLSNEDAQRGYQWTRFRTRLEVQSNARVQLSAFRRIYLHRISSEPGPAGFNDGRASPLSPGLPPRTGLWAIGQRIAACHCPHPGTEGAFIKPYHQAL